MPDLNPDDPDFDLLPGAVAGDIDAFEALVRRYQGRMVSLSRSLTGSADDAEDLAQEVFVRVYKALGSFRGESLFRTWLYKVAVNVARSHRARRSRQQAVWHDSGADEVTIFDAPDPADFEASWLANEAIARALDQLSEDLRLAVTLRDVQRVLLRESRPAAVRHNQAPGASLGNV